MVKKLLDSKQAGEYIGKSVSWLAHGRMGLNDARAILFIRIGRNIRYKIDDLDSFINDNRMDIST